MGAAIPRTYRDDSAQSAMQIQGSFQFDKNNSEYLSRTPGSGGNRKTWTMSFWMRRTVPGNSSRWISTGYNTSGGYGFYIGYNSDKFSFVANHDSIGLDLRPSAMMMDTSAWYHCVFALDTTQGSASDRAAIYINGEKVTDFGTESYPGQDTTPNWNNTSNTHTIGGWDLNGSMAGWFDGYLTQFYFIDGQKLDASYFGYTDPLTNTWRPKKYEGTYGTQGFNLPMDGSGATLGADQSGNANNWSLNNIDTADVCAQSPSGIVYAGKQRHGGSTTYNASRLPANYCTLDPNNAGGSATIKNAATQIDSSGASNTMGTHVIPPNSGKYYWECQVTNTMAGAIGIAQLSVANESALGDNPTLRGYGADGNKYYGSTGASYGSSMSHSGWVSVLFDSDARTLEFYYNGVSQGVAFTAGANGIVDGAYYAPCFYLDSMDVKVNFGANYAYSTTNWATVPPEGYKTLCDASLSQSTGVVIPEQYVKPVLWTGNETAGRQIEVGFNPDLIIGRARNDTQSWYWTDTVRGSNKFIYSNSDAQETTTSNVINVDDNNVKGFKVGSSGVINGSSAYKYLAYCFRAGGSKNTFNVDGSGFSTFAATGIDTTGSQITPSGCSIGRAAGLSIIKHTGTGGSNQKLPHGLGKNVQVYFQKNLTDNSVNWAVLGHALNDSEGGAKRYLLLNTDGAYGTAGQGPGDEVNIPLYGDATTNLSGKEYITYCFANSPGIAKFGWYVGNQNADGPFSNLGFKPAIVIIKNGTNSGTPWFVFDSARDPDNPIRLNLNPNDNAGEEDDTNGTWDWMANGAKMTSAGTHPNTNNSKILYMAWAENPFANLYGGQSNAK